MRTLPIVALLLVGCAAHKSRITAVPVLIVPRDCITKVELTPDTECYVGKDGQMTLCRHVNITRKAECEVLKVPEKEKRNEKNDCPGITLGYRTDWASSSSIGSCH